jgi:hypothetical protein
LGTTSEIEVVPSRRRRTRSREEPRERRSLPRAPPLTDSLAALSTVRARDLCTMGGVLCRPRHARVPRSRQEGWRERPRCARWKWPRACPEGSLTPSVSVSCLRRLRVRRRSRNHGESGPHVRAQRSADLRTTWSRSSAKFWSPNRTRSARHDTANAPRDRPARSSA